MEPKDLKEAIDNILSEPLEPVPCANCNRIPLDGCELFVETIDEAFGFCGWPCLVQFGQMKVIEQIQSGPTWDGWDGVVQVS